MIILQALLWILFALVVLLFLLLFMKFSVRLKYGEQNAVILGFGFVKINLTKLRERREKKRKKPKIQHLADTLPQEPAEQTVKTETSAQTEKASPQIDSKTENEEKTQDTQSASIGKMLGGFVKGNSLSENLTLLKEILVQTAKKFSKHASIKVKKLRVTVSCPEAADTAVLFGISNGVVSSVVGIIESFSMFSFENGSVGVYQDYLSGKSSLEVDIRFSMRVFRLISCAMPAIRILMTKGKNPHQRSNTK